MAIAEAVAERLKGRVGNPKLKTNCGNISTIEDGQKTRDLAAAKAGFGSGKTLEAAQAVIAEAVAERLKGRNHRPEKSGNISGLTDKGETRDLAAAKAVAERLKGRQGSNQFKAKGGGNISTSFEDSGKTRDLAAAGSPPDEPPLLRTMRASASGPPFATFP